MNDRLEYLSWKQENVGLTHDEEKELRELLDIDWRDR